MGAHSWGAAVVEIARNWAIAHGPSPTFGTPRAAQYDSQRNSYLQEPDRTLR